MKSNKIIFVFSYKNKQFIDGFTFVIFNIADELNQLPPLFAHSDNDTYLVFSLKTEHENSFQQTLSPLDFDQKYPSICHWRIPCRKWNVYEKMSFIL